MSQKLNISVIILTYNEEIHLRRCLDNVMQFAEKVFVIDCFSSDKTVEIAQEYHAQVVQHQWPGLYSVQFNWALENLPIETPWVLRLDADEYLSPELIDELHSKLPTLPEDVTGVVLPLRRIFLGRHMRNCDGIKLLRIFRYGCGRSETRKMDEHICLSRGTTVCCKNWFADHNLNPLEWWIQKHVGYAKREAADLLEIQAHTGNEKIEKQAAAKRYLKHRYAQLPLFWRAYFYFVYRYFIKMGFRDGKEGFLWDFLQAWWYRTLVDAIVWENISKTRVK